MSTLRDDCLHACIPAITFACDLCCVQRRRMCARVAVCGCIALAHTPIHTLSLAFSLSVFSCRSVSSFIGAARDVAMHCVYAIDRSVNTRWGSAQVNSLYHFTPPPPLHQPLRVLRAFVCAACALVALCTSFSFPLLSLSVFVTSRHVFT